MRYNTDVGAELASPPLQAESRTRQRITVVDDSTEFVRLLVDVFGNAFTVTSPEDTSIIRIADTQPDVLIIDLHLANGDGLTGWELVRLARSHKTLRSVPIIVCTADVVGLDNDGPRLAKYGNVHLMTKPFALDVIERLVGRVVGSDGAAAVSAAGA
jgi:CheY-like chemotaxis protein